MILVFMLVAAVLQALGYTSTCTQGANGTFISGAVLSSPLLLVSVILLIKHLSWPKVVNEEFDRIFNIYMISIVLVTAGMCFSHWDMAYFTLWLGTGPCGEDYVMYAPLSEYEGPNILIGLTYAIAPALIALLALAKIILIKRAKRP